MRRYRPRITTKRASITTRPFVQCRLSWKIQLCFRCQSCGKRWRMRFGKINRRRKIAGRRIASDNHDQTALLALPRAMEAMFRLTLPAPDQIAHLDQHTLLTRTSIARRTVGVNGLRIGGRRTTHPARITIEAARAKQTGDQSADHTRSPPLLVAGKTELPWLR